MYNPEERRSKKIDYCRKKGKREGEKKKVRYWYKKKETREKERRGGREGCWIFGELRNLRYDL